LDDRLGFIRKVYLLLSVQLSFSMLAILVTKSDASLNNSIKDLWWLALLCLFVAFIIFIPIMCFRSLARTTPLNYILLVAFTLCETFFFMWISSIYTAESVLGAGLMTLGMTIALTIYAFKT